MIALLGFGKTNQALLKLLNSQNKQALIFDDTFTQTQFDSFGNTLAPAKDFPLHPSNIQIPSPGIPPYHPLVQQSNNLVSEYDYLLENNPTQIWISGTNGKTTTTEMLEWILQDFGGIAGGNIGTPLATLKEINPKIYILETSSFTLHYTQKVFPFIYILLPLSEDHISWHGSFENYICDKLNPLQRMPKNSYALIPQELHHHKEVQSFQGNLILYTQNFFKPQSPLPFKEPFLLDALLALKSAKILTSQDLSQKLLEYKIGEHKIQEFTDRQNRIWVDDSKGTNIDATIWAIKAYSHKPIYLILGGDDKGANLNPLFKEMQQHNITIFAIGSNTAKLASLASSYHIPLHQCFELQKAIELIHQYHNTSSIALLSPAAASLDQFSSYKQRGDKFKEFVKNLS